MNLVTIEREDPLWEDNRFHCLCQVWWRRTYFWLMILHKKMIYREDIEKELESYHNKTEWANFVLMQDSWPQMKSDSISWRTTQKNSRNSQIQWPVVNTVCQETKVHLNQKVASEGTPSLDPYWKLQLVADKVNMEWKSELESVNERQFSLVGQNFSRLEQVGHELERQRAGNFRNAVQRMSVEIECKWFCNPVKGQSKTTKTYFCQLIHKDFTYWGEKLDWCWTRKIFALRFFTVEETDQSSSSW